MTYQHNGCGSPIDFEVVPEQEEAWRDEITAMTVQLQEKRKPLQDGEVLRGVHPKSHGCLNATFVVNKDLPDHMQVGLFQTPGRCFDAKIRYSNADVLKRADIETKIATDGTKVMQHGSRGMAIKVLDVDAPVLLADGASQNQDFLMVNTPEFAFRNVRDYRRLTAALLASEDGATPDLFFLPAKLLELGVMDGQGKLAPVTSGASETVQRLRGLFESLDFVFSGYDSDDVQGVLSATDVVRKIQGTSVRNPLNATYFGAAPFRFGPDRVMRFSVTPCESGMSEPDLKSGEMEVLHADYLSRALNDSISKKQTIALSFWVQIAAAANIDGRELTLIENASSPWNEREFEPVEVAKLIIQPDQSQDLLDACKPLLFTPWHALPAHTPLGGINRLRKPVYSASAQFRSTT
ncbi:MAG: hypothetical protein AB8B62_07740 [Roseobacter sp.]